MNKIEGYIKVDGLHHWATTSSEHSDGHMDQQRHTVSDIKPTLIISWTLTCLTTALVIQYEEDSDIGEQHYKAVPASWQLQQVTATF